MPICASERGLRLRLLASLGLLALAGSVFCFVAIFPHSPLSPCPRALLISRIGCRIISIQRECRPFFLNVREAPMIVDDVIDKFVDTFGEGLSLLLLQSIALPEHGGLGYKIVFFNPWIDVDGYDIDHKLKVINLDTESVFSQYSALDVAEYLKDAMQVEIAKTHAGLLKLLAHGAKQGW